MTKKGRQFFFAGKIGVTPSVAAAGDTNPSDATVYKYFLLIYLHYILRRSFVFVYIRCYCAKTICMLLNFQFLDHYLWL